LAGMFVIIFFWLALAVIVGIAAKTRGRDAVLWFFLAAIISPLIAGLLLLALARKDNALEGGPIIASPKVSFQEQKIRVASSIVTGILIVSVIVLYLYAR
jgi:hypothetical protein